MRIAMAQVNSTVGDLEGNVGKIRDFIKDAKGPKADFVTFPELAVTGFLLSLQTCLQMLTTFEVY